MSLKLRGMSLIEMLLAIGLSSILMTTAVGLTVSLLNARDKRRAGHDLTASMIRLEQQWRADMRAAISAKLKEPPVDERLPENPLVAVWRWQLADGIEVEYILQASTLRRTLSKGETVMGREEFKLPPGARVQCYQVYGGQDLAWLTVEYPASIDDPRSVRTWRIEALQAADHRFLTKGKE